MSDFETLKMRITEKVAEAVESVKHSKSLETFEVFADCMALHAKKNQDYGRADDPLANVRSSAAYGVPAWVGCLIREHDKTIRLQSYCQNGRLANEGVEDSLLDKIVYLSFALVLFREEQETAEHEDAKYTRARDFLATRQVKEVADQYCQCDIPRKLTNGVCIECWRTAFEWDKARAESEEHDHAESMKANSCLDCMFDGECDTHARTCCSICANQPDCSMKYSRQADVECECFTGKDSPDATGGCDCSDPNCTSKAPQNPEYICETELPAPGPGSFGKYPIVTFAPQPHENHDPE